MEENTQKPKQIELPVSPAKPIIKTEKQLADEIYSNSLQAKLNKLNKLRIKNPPKDIDADVALILSDELNLSKKDLAHTLSFFVARHSALCTKLGQGINFLANTLNSDNQIT